MNTPFKYDSLQNPKVGIIKQELITYEIHDGVLTKNIIERKFYENDYVDSQTNQVLVVLE